MTARDAFPYSASREPSEWASIPVELDTIAISEGDLEALREYIFEYACLETFGVMPDEFEEDFDQKASDCLELEFVKAVMIDDVEICLWGCRDTHEVWNEAFVVSASWDRPPLKTKGGLTSIGESEGLAPDQYIWRHFHLEIVPQLKR